MIYQVCPPLSADEYAALKADIAKNGVVVPIEVDEEDNILDGHHRVRAWQELRSEGVSVPDYPFILRPGMSEQEKRNHARRLNALRRQLSREQRASLIVDMRQDGMSYRQIGEAVGVDAATAHRTVANATVEQPATITGRDGKERPATMPQWTEPRKVPHVTHNSGENEWYTPAPYIEAARLVMGGIDLDPASSAIANRTVRATDYFTRDDDGLQMQWSGRVWMNPPYSQPEIGQFCKHLRDSVERGTVTEAITLTNNATETAWFSDLFAVASAVCFVKGRIRFIDANGETGSAPLQGQAICYIGDNPDAFQLNFSQFGVVLYA